MDKQINTVVYYHANCADGFMAAFCIWMKYSQFGENEISGMEFIPVNYGYKPDIDFLKDKLVYVVDFSFEPEVMKSIMEVANIVWLDHHKTSIEAWNAYKLSLGVGWVGWNENNVIVHDTTKSGAMLAWEHIWGNTLPPNYIKWTDDRDRWVFQYPESRAFHIGMQTHKPWDFYNVYELLHLDGTATEVAKKGLTIIDFINGQVEQAIKASVHKNLQLPDGTTVPVVITNSPNNISEVGEAIYKQNPSAIAVMWFYSYKEEKIICSLRSDPSIDASVVATQFSGGGHPQACGFKISVEDFFKVFTNPWKPSSKCPTWPVAIYVRNLTDYLQESHMSRTVRRKGLKKIMMRYTKAFGIQSTVSSRSSSVRLNS